MEKLTHIAAAVLCSVCFLIVVTPQYAGAMFHAPTLLVAVDDDEQPTTFALHQNYPNPFNPTTVIRYEVAWASHVRLVVYNLLGQKVATLVDRRQQSGSYTVTFNGAHLASGIYILSMEAGESFHAMRHMVLMK